MASTLPVHAITQFCRRTAIDRYGGTQYGNTSVVYTSAGLAAESWANATVAHGTFEAGNVWFGNGEFALSAGSGMMVSNDDGSSWTSIGGIVAVRLTLVWGERGRGRGVCAWFLCSPWAVVVLLLLRDYCTAGPTVLCFLH